MASGQYLSSAMLVFVYHVHITSKLILWLRMVLQTMASLSLAKVRVLRGPGIPRALLAANNYIIARYHLLDERERNRLKIPPAHDDPASPTFLVEAPYVLFFSTSRLILETQLCSGSSFSLKLAHSIIGSHN
jgi:hypothetical protein